MLVGFLLDATASPSASCWPRCLGCCCPRASSLAAVLLAHPTAGKLLERACVMPSPCDHEALGVLLGVCCASAQPCAAQRRLTPTGVNDFSVIHTPFPIRFRSASAGFRPELYRKF